MSNYQILPPLTMVKDTMDDVAVTSYNRPESSFIFERRQEVRLRILPSLLPRLLQLVAAAPSTDSSPEAGINSVPFQFQLPRHKGKALVLSQGPTSSNSEF